MLLPVRCGGAGGTAGAETGTKQAPQHHQQRPHERPSGVINQIIHIEGTVRAGGQPPVTTELAQLNEQ